MSVKIIIIRVIVDTVIINVAMITYPRRSKVVNIIIISV